MSNKAIIPSGLTVAKPVNGLEDFIQFYKNSLHGHYTDVTHGESMLQLGAKTSTIQQLENLFANPLGGLISAHNQMEESLRKVVEQLFASYFKNSIDSNLIKAAFKISHTGNSVSYGVVLQKDTFKNREQVLNFLIVYNTFEFAGKIRVYIQFVPDNLKSAFDNVEYIS